MRAPEVDDRWSPARARRCPPGRVAAVLRRLARAIDRFDEPAVGKIARVERRDPFRVLVATMLSAQTRDEVTAAAARRLFRAARTPRAVLALSARTIERLIYPVSFYRHKARHLVAACRLLVERHGGRVPARIDDLVALPGVGRKTATLVLIEAHGSDAHICVDTHVHRLANRLGWVETKRPDETEQALYRVVPRRYWPLVNRYLVTWGQHVCRPVYPVCGACVVADLCPRRGVARVGRKNPGASTGTAARGAAERPPR
jgi:endonuclease-3